MLTTDGLALDGVLSAKLAWGWCTKSVYVSYAVRTSGFLTDVAGVLCDLEGVSATRPVCDAEIPGYAHLHLLDLLSERGTVTGTVLSGDADLLCAYIAIRICPDREGREPYAWSFWRLCRVVDGNGSSEVEVSDCRSPISCGCGKTIAEPPRALACFCRASAAVSRPTPLSSPDTTRH
jgi:hypothetical protein